MNTLKSAIVLALLAGSTGLMAADSKTPAAAPGAAAPSTATQLPQAKPAPAPVPAAVAATPMMPPSMMPPAPAFGMVDSNHDGNVTEQEFNEFRADRMAKRAAEGRPMANAANAPSFKDIDANGDGNVTPEEFAQHQKARRGMGPGAPGAPLPFGIMDADHDGGVTQQEYDDFVAKQKQATPPPPPGMGGMGGMAGGPTPAADSIPSFKELDANGDGKATHEEIVAQRRANAGGGRAPGGFKAVDLDQNGTVSKEELEKFRADREQKRAASGRPMPPPGRQLAFEQMDANGDGQLTPEEFATAHRRAAPQPPMPPGFGPGAPGAAPAAPAAAPAPQGSAQ